MNLITARIIPNDTMDFEFWFILVIDKINSGSFVFMISNAIGKIKKITHEFESNKENKYKNLHELSNFIISYK